MKDKQLQLGDFIKEFGVWWRILKNVRDIPNPIECYNITMGQLMLMGEYDENYIKEYFDGNWEDVVSITEGLL